MKSLVRSFLLLALLAGLIYSCQKDNFEEPEIIIPKITNAKVLDNIETVYNPANLEQNPMDLNAIVNYDVKTYSNSKSYIKFYFYNFY